MREYQSHKKVKAAQIVAVESGESAETIGHRLDDGQFITMVAMINLHRADYTPVVGDYLVEYEDGYRSISPQKAFEDGYTAIYAARSNQL